MMSVLKRWSKGWRLALIVYAVLLTASHLWRTFEPNPQHLQPHQEVVSVQEVNADGPVPGKNVLIAYTDRYSGSAKNPPVVLLLHGSPVSTPMFRKLIPELSDSFRVIAPDLPGYGASTRAVSDYSMRSYSGYMEQFMDSLNIQSAHVVGYSLGGGIALNLAHFYPYRVRSVGMLSALGVQELELMGSYTINHAIHGMQVALVWTLSETVPHFGMLDELNVNISYARSFYDSDQRPIRAYLKAFRKPMIIQHGKKDRFVPLAAAREHQRIVPQSMLRVYDGGHGIVGSKPERIANDLSDFITSVEKGTAKTYAEADPARLTEAKKTFEDVGFSEFEGISLILMMVLIALSTLVSEDLACIGAGLMAARGLIGFWPAVMACLIGIVIGDMGLYLAGRWLGRPALKRAPFKWFITESDLEKSADWFLAKGPAIIIASRFLPGSRLPTYFSAGVIGAGFWMFSFYFFLAALVWTPLLVGLSMVLGSELIRYFSLYQGYAIWVFMGAVLALFFIAKVLVPAFSYRGRKLLRSRYCRLANWEFWPPYVLYAPVCCYIIYLWFKYRSPTLFTAANPAIPDGGFIGESKYDILKLFDKTGLVAAYAKIGCDKSTADRIDASLAFMENNNLDFPIYLKPDEGQRGAGVRKVKSGAQLRRAIKECPYDLIIQEDIPGKEYGIFYYRYPNAERGYIYSITTKEFMTLKGDGRKTLEELILEDNRAICLGERHMAEHEDRLYRVPANGVEIKLVEYGSHARGAIFGDGEHLITETLRSKMDEICKKAEGFYYGRFDIRTESDQSLKRGEKLKIIEVNGVTSESTNIYDADNTFWDAQKILMSQWALAFDIGKENVKKGATISSSLSLLKKLFTFRSKK